VRVEIFEGSKGEAPVAINGPAVTLERARELWLDRESDREPDLGSMRVDEDAVAAKISQQCS
jgi:hypothetical protein